MFAGAGGGILGGHLLGWRTVCAVEYEPYAASVLVARQNDGILAPFPIWDDVRDFDGKPWRGLVDVVSGGFPCQDISCAGKGAGITGERSGLWKEMARIIGEVRPSYAFIENSPMLTTRGLDTVLCDLAAMGYDAEWGCISAADCGANHIRDRVWIVANSKSRESGLTTKREGRENSIGGSGNFSRNTSESNTGRGELFPYTEHERNGWRKQQQESTEKTHDGNPYINRGSVIAVDDETSRMQDVGNANSAQCQGTEQPIGIESEHAYPGGFSWWKVEPDVGRVVDGLAARVDRLKAIGNGQVSRVAATAFTILSERIG